MIIGRIIAQLTWSLKGASSCGHYLATLGFTAQEKTPCIGKVKEQVAQVAPASLSRNDMHGLLYFGLRDHLVVLQLVNIIIVATLIFVAKTITACIFLPINPLFLSPLLVHSVYIL
jgi:hypothetical protein